MAWLLYRLGRASFRRRRLVALAWLLALVGGGVAAGTLAGQTSDAFSIPGTESQRALDLLAERFPSTGVDGATARVVFTVPAGVGATLNDPPSRAAVEQTVRDLGGAPKVSAVTSPYDAGPAGSTSVSLDGRTAYAQVSYAVQAGEITPEDQHALQNRAGAARAAGLGVEFGGDATQERQEQSITEVIGVVVAGLVLVLTLGSLTAAGLPLLNALIGVTLGLMGVQVATGFFELSASSSTLALMLGLAVSVDYALFIVSRYRHERALGRDPEDAAGRAIGTAGSAVVFAGLTVVIALSALSVVGIPFLTAMGLAAAGTVVVAVVIALTLLPAMLGFAGDKVLGSKRSRRKAAAAQPQPGPRKPTLGARWVGLTLRHRLPAVLACVLTLGVLAVPALDLRLGMPGEDTRPPESTQRKAYEQLAAGFGPGFNGPLLIAVQAPPGTDVSGPVGAVRDRLRQHAGVVAVTEARINAGRDTAIVTVVPATGPAAAATTDLVERIRASAADVRAQTGLTIAVTGATALTIDVSDKLDRALLPYLAVVVGLAFVLLLLVFRSVLVPIKAAVGFLLSVAATFGAVVAIFQWGWLAGPLSVASVGPIVSFLPIFLIGLTFGLAMDYEVFLVTRMREEFVHGAPADRAIAVGFEHGARVVSAAAVIMISVFGGFMLAPEPIIQSIGFALAFAVLVDAFLVRMTLVPAALSLLGPKAWWLPRWLDRALPVVDVEGERLRARLAGHAPAPGAEPSPAPAAVPPRPAGLLALLAAAPPPAPTEAAEATPAPAEAAEAPMPRAEIFGQVTAGAVGVPAAVVTVLDLHGGQVAVARVGSEGSYRAAVPAGGTYLVLASAAGHQPTVHTLAVNSVPVRRDFVVAARDDHDGHGPTGGGTGVPGFLADHAPR
jgi:putative drug exporter of the RND superfamily